MSDTKTLIERFQDFVSSEVGAAVKELEGITTESNRKHLQRLVYVDLVNRFDTLIDDLLLSFSTQEGDFKKRY